MKALLLPVVLTPLLVTAGWGSSTSVARFPVASYAAVSALPLAAPDARFVSVRDVGSGTYRVRYRIGRSAHALVALVAPAGDGFWRLREFRLAP